MVAILPKFSASNIPLLKITAAANIDRLRKAGIVVSDGTMKATLAGIK
jgi:hypothetical protein